MWLPKDERKVLRKYRDYIRTIDESIHFTDLSERTYNATRNLIERELLHEIKEGGREHSKYVTTCLTEEQVSLKDFLLFSEEDSARYDVVLQFTLKGLDLAGRYDWWFTRTGLWFAEYKDHWFWLIVGFLGGIMGALIVNWLSQT